MDFDTGRSGHMPKLQLYVKTLVLRFGYYKFLTAEEIPGNRFKEFENKN